MDFRCGVKMFLAIGFDLLTLVFISVWVFLEKLVRILLPRRLKSLEGEIILVTGAGNGIGRQIALELAAVAPTATIVCWDYDARANEAIVAEIKRKNVKAIGYVLDVSDRKQVADIAAKMRREVGDVSIVMNNAGIVPTGKFLEQDLDSMERTFQINVLAHFWILRQFLPKMIEKNHGHVVSTASLSALIPAREIAVYAASKHAVHGFIESFRNELNALPTPPNIHFSTVYPIFVQTRVIDGVKFKPRFEGMVPIITPQYVAQKVVEGFRRNYEYILLPPSTMILALAKALLPLAIWRKLEEDVFRCEVELSPIKTSVQTGIPDYELVNGNKN